MSPTETSRSVLRGHLRAAIDREIRTADRVATVLTPTVPWQFPGHLLLAAAEFAPESVDQDRALEGAVSIELASLHQYLHGIPRTGVDVAATAEGDGRTETDGRGETSRGLSEPAAGTVYAADPTAAIIDGDFLQARAFGRLTALSTDASAVIESYGAFASASIESYERTAVKTTETTGTAMAPLAGAAARLGGRLGGLDRATRTRLGELARQLGERVPALTPAGWVGSATPAVTETAIEELAGVFPETREAASRIGELVGREIELSRGE